MKRFQFSLKVTAICLLLALGMVRASYWQWQRHQEKLKIIGQLEKNLQAPVIPLSELLKEAETAKKSEIEHRRVAVSGVFDFEHEMILRNRRHEELPGVFVLTPLRSENTPPVLVNRGFIPLEYSGPKKRVQFQRLASTSFTALLKRSERKRLFAPSDPEAGPNLPWVDAWLRVDLEKMSLQLPYKLFPYYLEKLPELPSGTPQELTSQIVRSKSTRSEMFSMMGQVKIASSPGPDELHRFPIPQVNTVIPPGRHLGYVYEWAAMAVATLLIGIVLQLRRGAPLCPM